MITVCPKCGLKLTVTSGDLAVAQGYVRCGRCANVFNALSALVDEQQPAAASPPQTAAPKPTPPPPPPARQAPPPEKRAPVETAPPPPPPPRAEENEGIDLEFDATSTNVTGVFIPPGNIRADESIPGTSPMDEVTVTNVRPVQQPVAQTRRAAPPAQSPTTPPPTRARADTPSERNGNSSAARIERKPAAPPSRNAQPARGAAPPRTERPVPPSGGTPDRSAPTPAARNGRNGLPPSSGSRIERNNGASPARKERNAAPPAARTPRDSAGSADIAARDFILPSDDGLADPSVMRADRGNSQSALRVGTSRFPSNEGASPIRRRILDQRYARVPNFSPAIAWSAGSVLMFLVLVAQIVHHYRSELAAQPKLFRPMTAVYRTLGLSLIPKWDLAAYEVRQLGAVAGRENPGQLAVRASVKNGARNSQPLPLLRVIVQDRFGNRVAARDVPPSVYAARRAARSGYIGAGQRIDAEIRFVDPGQIAVGFEIDACLPVSGGGIVCAGDEGNR